ncbi:MAG: omega-6 fatty acid desaturase (delta-12 desaturase) [Mariniblastus sp.]|jgi:omega-6 fatty acid desaturase (delta-12 desaturase)
MGGSRMSIEEMTTQQTVSIEANPPSESSPETLPNPTAESWDSDAILENEKNLDRQLLIASKQYATEQRGRSWFHLLTTLLALAVFVTGAALGHFLAIRIIASVLTGLTVVRVFILYHDYQHNAIFKNSWLGGGILNSYGFLMLTPPSVWKRSHDHHHKNNSKLFGASIGSFPIMTTENYLKASASEQREYRISRSPLIMLFGYFTVFLFGMCVRPFLVDHKRHWDGGVSIVLHCSLITASFIWLGWLTTVLVFIAPAMIATCSGAYLFYAQHNFPTAKIRPRDKWSYTGAALQSSSFLKMSPVMHWFTGNIGYHHVHHLNSKIPFYRLPEAMSELEPLRTPNTTTLRLGEICKCLSLKLWDAPRDRFITFAEAKE